MATEIDGDAQDITGDFDLQVIGNATQTNFS